MNTLSPATLDGIDELRAADRRRHARSAIAAMPATIADRIEDGLDHLEAHPEDAPLIHNAMRKLIEDIRKGCER